MSSSSSSDRVTLHSYWRSSSSYRVRIALNFHKISYDYHAVNLLKNEQQSTEHCKLNPAALIPVLQIGDAVLSESLSIIEYLEESRGRILLPENILDRAEARQIAYHIAMNMQPVQNLKVLKKISQEFGEEHKMPWAKYVNENGLDALEKMLENSAGTYCVKDQVTIADCCLVPQVYNAKRFGVDMSKYPITERIFNACMELEEFKNAEPSQMPDAQ